MVDLAANHPRKLHGRGLEGDIQRIEEAVEENFLRTRGCIEMNDPHCALQLLKEYEWVSPQCDTTLMDLVREKDPTIPAGEAAAITLYVRWLKRVNSHLRNIVTSVVNPFHRIGFEPRMNGEQTLS
jgi:hypothetical protein